MKHNGIIPSDEADKLYSYPTLSGDSDTFLNGAGDFEHPHQATIAAYTSSWYGRTNQTSRYNYNVPVPYFVTDKYGHITAVHECNVYRSIPNASSTGAGLMTADDKIKFDEMYAWYSAQKEG